MNPNTGELITARNLAILRETDPERAAGFTVQLDGPAEDIANIAEAVRAHVDAAEKAKRRAKNRAARKARKASR